MAAAAPERPVPSSSEDAEVERTQLYAAIQAAQGKTLEDAALYGSGSALRGLPSLQASMRLRSGLSPDGGWGNSTLTRTHSAVRGPVTDGKGLGSLAPYVLPGMLRRNSMALSSQMSALQMFPSQRFPEDLLGSDGEARPFTSPMVQQQQQLDPGARTHLCGTPCFAASVLFYLPYSLTG